MIDINNINIEVAGEKHVKYVDEILDTIARAAKVRGTGIAKRSPEYVRQKMLEHKAVVATYEGRFAGFSYIESWSNRQFVANSGLIVADEFRGIGLAKRIKRNIFELSRKMFPDLATDRRRGFLERMRKLREFRHTATQRQPYVPLHRHAL